jgi:hypothetical protein
MGAARRNQQRLVNWSFAQQFCGRRYVGRIKKTLLATPFAVQAFCEFAVEQYRAVWRSRNVD